MSVWFAYRSHYDLPATKFVKRFEEASLLEWFRSHCKPIAGEDEATAYADNLFGGHVRGFDYFLNRLAEGKVPPPRNNRELQAAFGWWGVEGDWLFQPHAIEGLDDDDEREMAYYLFDDVFAKKHPERVAWLMREGWELPAEAGAGTFTPAFRSRRLGPRGRHEGATWLVFLACHDSYSLSDLTNESYRIDGVRLPQLVRLLSRATEAEREKEWCVALEGLVEEAVAEGPESDPMEQALLRELRTNPHDDAPWAVYGDWLEEHGRPRAELWLLERALARIGGRPLHLYPEESTPKDTPNRSCWRVSPHVAQLCWHNGTVWGKNCFEHWALFDDLWAAANPDLANSLIRQLDRWDVLAPAKRARS